MRPADPILPGGYPGDRIITSAHRILAAAEKRAEQGHARAVSDGDALAAFVHGELRGLFSTARTAALGPDPERPGRARDAHISRLGLDRVRRADDRFFEDLRAALRDDRLPDPEAS